MDNESISKPQDHALPNEDPEHNTEHKFESLQCHGVSNGGPHPLPKVPDTESPSISYDLYQERRANLLQQRPRHNVEANTPTEDPKPLQRKKHQPTFITGDGNVVHDNEAKELIEALKKSESDAQNREDESKEVFITRDGDIQRGEDAIVGKAFLEIKQSCPKCDKSFTITLKDPGKDDKSQAAREGESDPAEVEQTAEDKSPEANHLSEDQPPIITEDGITDCADHEAKDVEIKPESEDKDETQDASVQKPQASSQSDSHEDHTPTVDSTASDIDTTSHIRDDLDESDSKTSEDESDANGTVSLEAGPDGNASDSSSESETMSDEEEHKLLTQHVPASKVIKKVNEHKRSKISSNKDVLKAKKKAVIGEVTAASTDAKIIDEDVQVFSSKTTVTGGEVSVGTAEAKLVDTKVKTGHIVTKVKGAEVKAAAAGLKGLQAETGASVSVTTKASTTTAGSVDATGANVDVQATVEITAQGADCKTAKATITGVKNEAKVSGKVTASCAKIKAGVAEVTGVENGATAEASAEATGIEVRAGTAQISGPKLSAAASATAKAGTVASVGTATIAAFDGIGTKASVSAQGGVHAFSFQAGISGRAAVHASTATSVGCISVAPGLPKIGLGPRGFFNFGFGGIDGQSGVYTAVAGDPNGVPSSTPGNRNEGHSDTNSGHSSGGSSSAHEKDGHSADTGGGSGGSSSAHESGGHSADAGDGSGGSSSAHESGGHSADAGDGSGGSSSAHESGGHSADAGGGSGGSLSANGKGGSSDSTGGGSGGSLSANGKGGSSDSTGDGSGGSSSANGIRRHSDAGSGSGVSSWSGLGNMFPKRRHDSVGADGHKFETNITEEDVELNQKMSDVHLQSSLKVSGTIRANVTIGNSKSDEHDSLASTEDGDSTTHSENHHSKDNGQQSGPQSLSPSKNENGAKSDSSTHPNLVSSEQQPAAGHIELFLTLEKKHSHKAGKHHKKKSDTSKNTSGPYKSANMLPGTESDYEHDCKLQGASAKLQAMVNEHYDPPSPVKYKRKKKREVKTADIDRVKRTAIKRLHKLEGGVEGETTQSTGAGSNPTESKHKHKKKTKAMKAKPFGSKGTIHTLDCFRMGSTRPIVDLGGGVCGFGN